MIQVLDKYGNTSTDDGRVIIIDKFGNIKKPAVSSGTVTSIVTAFPLTGGPITNTGTISIPKATTSIDGYLSSTDWNTFNSKFNLPVLTSGSVLFSNGTTIAQNTNFFWDDTNNRLNFNCLGTTNRSRINFRSSNVGTKFNGIHWTDTNDTQSYGYISLDSSTGEMRMFTSATYFPTFYSSGAEGMRLNASRNLLINTTTDNGGKLQIKAPGALSTDIALRVRNSADTGNLMTVNGLGTLSVTTASQRISFNLNNGIYLGLGVNNNAIGVNNSNRLFIGSEGDFPIYSLANGTVIISNSANPTSSASAKFRIDSTTQGFLPPRMTNAERLAIATPAIGLMVYCTDATEGLYINKSTGWTFII
jgi:hypothetical protein